MYSLNVRVASRWGFVAALTLLAAISTTEQHRDLTVDEQVRDLELRADDVSRRLAELEAEFLRLGNGTLNSDVNLDALKRLEKYKAKTNDRCSDNEVSCGADYWQCVHRFLFCDGFRDCHNGYDESDNICSGRVVTTGSAFRGQLYVYSCMPHAVYSIVIVVSSARRSPFFGAKTYVTARFLTEMPPAVDGADAEPRAPFAYSLSGYFEHATRRLVLTSDPGQIDRRARHVCQFGDRSSGRQDADDRADCKVVVDATGDGCGRYKIVRVR